MMVAEEIKTKEDIWGDIRENFILELTDLFCQNRNDPFDLIRAKKRATKIADRLVSAVCQKHAGRELYVPSLPRCLRLVRDKQIIFDFDGGNHDEIGAAAPFRSVKSRQVRRILKLAKDE